MAKWSYIRRASVKDTVSMLEAIKAENEFQQQEPHGWDEDCETCPITFKLEKHDAYQMQAYMPSGKMMDGFHEIFIRCSVCKEISVYGGDDDSDQTCSECYAALTECKF